MSAMITPFQLLELNIISAQDLVSVSRHMKTYAVAWVHPDRKLTTRVDNSGRTNPTWNDKFVFRVNEEFLGNDTSAIMIEIYALHWFRDVHVGTVRVLVDNLLPPPTKRHQKNPPQFGMRFAALQVRRPSGRPQGILNVGVATLDSSKRSMPLYTMDQSAVGYRTLMGETEVQSHQTTSNMQQYHHKFINPNQQFHHSSTYGKPELRRTFSDSSSMIEVAPMDKTPPRRTKRGGSVVNVGGSGSDVSRRQLQGGSSKGSSVVSGSDVMMKKNKKKVKNRSMLNGSFVGGGGSAIRTSKERSGEASVITNSNEQEKNERDQIQNRIRDLVPTIIESVEAAVKDINNHNFPPPPPPKLGKEKDLVQELPPLSPTPLSPTPFSPPPQQSKINGKQSISKASSPNRYNNEMQMRSKARSKVTNSRYSGMDFGTTSYSRPASRLYAGLNYGGNSRTYNFAPPGRPVITDSELGPSASEVAENIANTRYYSNNNHNHYNHYNNYNGGGGDDESSIAGGLSLDGSIEGLRSKLARWRTELPPVYDNSEYNSSYSSSHVVKAKGANKKIKNGSKSGSGVSAGGKHKRRNTEGDGLFSCFSTICGVECSISCGGPKSPGGRGAALSNQKKNKNGIRTPTRNNHVVDDDDISYL